MSTYCDPSVEIYLDKFQRNILHMYLDFGFVLNSVLQKIKLFTC